MLNTLHLLLPLILHWGIAVALIIVAIAVFILLPFQLAKQVAIAVGVGAAIYIFAYSVGDRDGAGRKEAYYQELIRQTEALAAQHSAAAQADEAATVAALNARISDLTATLEENDHAAQSDPNAGGLGIGADSVRRLNAVGHAAQAR